MDVINPTSRSRDVVCMATLYACSATAAGIAKSLRLRLQNSRTDRIRTFKIGGWICQMMRDIGKGFKVKRPKVKVRG